MYEMDGKMDSLVVLHASCVSRFSEVLRGPARGRGGATVEGSSVEICGCRWQ